MSPRTISTYRLGRLTLLLLLLLPALFALPSVPPLHAWRGTVPPPPNPTPAVVHLPLVVNFPLPTPIPPPPQPTLRVAGWNVNSGGSDPQTIADQMAAFDGVDLWGVVEVAGTDEAALYAEGAASGEGTRFASVLGTTGFTERLLILYDADRFTLRASAELMEINWEERVRAPLYAHFHDRMTDRDLLFMVNHLYYANEGVRSLQADGLRAWAQSQTLPVVAVGDYNFHWPVEGEGAPHDGSYDRMTEGGIWRWVRPTRLVTTICRGWPCAEEWILDFIFVAGDAQGWRGVSTIVVRPGDFPENALTSDHRPVMAEFTLPRE